MSEFTTPMMKQYEEIKKQYADCLLFYRLGDFYELFMDDAHVGAKVLDLTLTGRPRGKDGRIPMAGVPFHAVDSYLAKLVKAGYKVAICEQVSEPDKHGIVEREVVRIVTPGTVLDEKTLERKENNYIVSICFDNKYIGIACADVSTGSFLTAQFTKDNYSQIIINEMSRLKPSECILPKFLYDNTEILRLIKIQPDINIFCYHNWDSVTTNPTALLKSHFKIKTLATFEMDAKPQAQIASAALIGYLQETQKNQIDHFRVIGQLISSEHVSLDRSTINNLELFSTLRDGNKQGSVLNSIDYTITAMGGRMLRQWLRRPLTSSQQIIKRHSGVKYFIETGEVRSKIELELENVVDIERIVARLTVGIGNARDMIGLKNSLKNCLRIREILTDSSAPEYLKNIARGIPVIITEVINLIETTILEDPKFDPKEGGIIKSGVNQNVDELRSIVNHGAEWISELEKAERERTGINSLKVRYNKVFGFYIEISNSNLNLIPDNYNRKQTLVNGERFITPELKKQEEIIVTAEEKLRKIEYEKYLEVLKVILENISEIQETASKISEIDCLYSHASIARERHYVQAMISNSDQINVTNGRHPVVEQIMTERQFVPNSVVLDNKDNQLWIITGPNMAGKSVFIRQVALLVLLNQIGSFIPAEKAELAIVDRIFVRSGASDVISEGLSTFMVEMVETAQIMHQATDKSLIVMDEIGRGTSTYDGISIAWAIAEYIVTNRKNSAKTLFATHYHELQDLANKYPDRIKNYHMSVHESNGELHFLHTIKNGGASHSFGVAVAKLAGIPDKIISAAQSMLHKLEHRENISQPAQLPLTFNDTEKIISNELSDLDIHQMTPLQALNKLAELKNKIKVLESSRSHLFKAD